MVVNGVGRGEGKGATTHVGVCWMLERASSLFVGRERGGGGRMGCCCLQGFTALRNFGSEGSAAQRIRLPQGFEGSTREDPMACRSQVRHENYQVFVITLPPH